MKMTQQGFSMLEVLVTIAITIIGLAGLTAMQMQSIRTVEDSGNRTHAIWIANDLINRIGANKTAAASYVQANEIRCDNIPAVRMCSSYFDGTDQVPAEDCSNAENAVFDVWESLCGTSALVDGLDAETGSASFINDPGLTITDNGDGTMQITISWNSRTSGTDIDGNTVYFLDDGEIATNPRESYSQVFMP
ncbi:MAG TPA: type IV pilus modification protein PilV [Oceanospirillales bacterium]|nr:type IV pilus modification protein PilV [Oceanospirillaceae bacterium]HBS42801.1 type IV pilus modification protein PilV [Oceanospirillales bacterium]|tara:strand:+ start:94 stop:669 length:576 start_codon:yes stop_codon:yes gene_type:complete